MSLKKGIFLLFYFSVLVCSINMSCKKPVDDAVISSKSPTAMFNVSEQITVVNKIVIFSDISTDPENDIIAWTWNFFDGTASTTTQNTTHAFTKAGSFQVTLTVKDKSGNTAYFSKRILVKNISAPDYGSLGSGLKEKIALLYPKAMICAHRTYHENFPENSLPGVQAAIDNQINFIEIDARLTLDNELVLMHDATTNRTTNGNYTISQRLLSELKSLKLLFNGVASTYDIPTLKEALTLSKGKVYVNIDASWDVTENYYNKIYNEVAALNMVNMVFFYTESPQVAKALIEMDNDVIVLLGAGNNTDWNNANNMNPKPKLWHLATATLNSNYTTTPLTEGIRFFANAYVNSTVAPPAAGNDVTVENLLTNKVSIIQTDYPLKIKNYLMGKGLWIQ